MSSAEIIGQNIKKVREQKGVKQEVLGKLINVSKSRMSQIENGDCEELSIRKMDKIAVYLQTDFFVLTENNPQNVNLNSNCFNDTHYNFSPDLIKALADELAKRMNK